MLRRGILVVVALAAVVLFISLVTQEPSVSTPLAPSEGGGGGVPMDTALPAPPEVETLLENGRFWRAAQAMRAHLESNPGAAPELWLVAARAEARWGGWERVHSLLEGKPWLTEVAGGEGWFWLARAREEAGDWSGAVEGYERYLAVEPTPRHQELARLRHGLALLRTDRVRDGVESLQRLRGAAPEISERIGALVLEARAAQGDTAGVRALADEVVRAFPERAQRATIRAYREAGDIPGVLRLARSYQVGITDGSRQAELSLEVARAALELGAEGVAREELRTALRAAPGGSAAREAARLLGEMEGLTPVDRLAIARVFDRHGNERRAAAGYRAWLDAGVGSAEERAEVRLRLGKALFSMGEYGEAEPLLRSLADAPAATAAEALYTLGRAQYRRGRREVAFETFTRVADRFPGSEPGAEALFLVADLSHDEEELVRARRAYRRVATEFPGTDRAGLSLMRLGGMAFLEGDYRAAAAAWEEYRQSYPRGERWLQATYWLGRTKEAVGDAEAARGLYRAVADREPLSYYALQSAERLGTDYWPIPMEPAPPRNPEAEAQVSRWIRSVELLREAGLQDEAEDEVDRLIRRAGDDVRLLYPLAEALNERGFSVRGIRLGFRLQKTEPTNPRLLRILYPFPYREMVAAEARERGLDPFLAAALIRQESMFKARISSPVGARGLMQVMPETGRPLARAAGIRHWDPELLFQPEINTHLGMRFLAEQMGRYDGSLPSVFSAYNAGPNRVEQWKSFPEYGNEELFTERIPYRETRDYVKILTRNIAVYRGLYGGDG